MDRELTRAELDELLPLFAADALDGEEREQVARYLERDETARAEVDSLREALTFLADSPRDAPDALWRGIEDALRSPTGTDAAAPAPVLTLPRRPPDGLRRASRRTRVLAVAAAVFVLLAVSVSALLAVKVADQQDRIDALATEMRHDTMAHQAEMAMAEPGAHSAVLTSSGGESAQVVMLPDGSGYFMHSDLRALPAGRTYQLWAVVDDGTGGTRYVSVGVLGRDPSVVAFRADDHVTGFVVTAEPPGGASAPSGDMMLEGSMA